MGLAGKPKSVIITVLLIATQIHYLVGHYAEETISDGEVFDFIVVGGGTAGCVVAARLAEGGRHKILVVEAGGLPNPNLTIPVYSPYFASDPNSVRIWQSVPQSNAGLINNGIVNFTRGEVLGGSSSVNGMTLNRGSPHSYDDWARVTGDSSWEYNNLLQYFRKYENYVGNTPTIHRGFGGPVQVERHRYAPLEQEWMEAARELNYPYAEPNPQIISFTSIDQTHKHGRRVSSYSAYIEPLLRRPSSPSTLSSRLHLPHQQQRRNNLLILLRNEAKRILFEGNKAVGVTFRSKDSGIVRHARARKEVILSAGVIDSATLLMKSGIGPKSVLDRSNIPVVKHLPVGKNFHDRVTSTLTIVIGNVSAVLNMQRDLNPETWRIFEEFGDGPYTSYQGQSIQAFIGSSVRPQFEKELGWADVQLLPVNSNVEGVLGGGVPVSDLRDWETSIRWAAFVGRPRSRGTVTLDPKNIDNAPLIDFQYLTHPDDMKAMIEGFRLYLKICEQTSGFQRLGCRVPKDRPEACQNPALVWGSDAYWECYIKQLATFGYHVGGTCRMGKGPQDSEAVVDSKLSVIGIENLRVVDGSVVPTVINGNLQGSIYVIAEKAADMILKRWGLGYIDFKSNLINGWLKKH